MRCCGSDRGGGDGTLQKWVTLASVLEEELMRLADGPLLRPLVLSALLGFAGVYVCTWESPSTILWEDRHLIYGDDIICHSVFL